MWKLILGTIGTVLVVMLVLSFFGVFNLGIKYFTAPIKGAVDAQIEIESGASRIAKYNRFFQLCAAAQAQQLKLAAQRIMYDKTENEDVKKIIFTNISGIEAKLIGTVAEYNTEVLKEYTSARFKDKNLPKSLNTNHPITCQ